MTKSILCAIIIGFSAGATAYIMPLLLVGIITVIGVMSTFYCIRHKHQHIAYMVTMQLKIGQKSR